MTHLQFFIKTYFNHQDTKGTKNDKDHFLVKDVNPIFALLGALGALVVNCLFTKPASTTGF
jgi:hypothetical protein